MDVSRSEVEPDGQELLQVLVSLTGLPEEWVRRELDHILEKSGKGQENLTLDELRAAMVIYLESIQKDWNPIEEE